VWLFIVAPLVGAVLAVLVVSAIAAPRVVDEVSAESGPLPVDRTGAELPPETAPAPRGPSRRQRTEASGQGDRRPFR
jgi:hypothetical protein